MSNLEDFLGKGKESDLKGEKIQGSFMCQECSEIVHEARLNYDEKSLSWICGSRHVSNVGMDV